MDRAARMNMWITIWEKTSQQIGYVPIFLKFVLLVLSIYLFQRRTRHVSSDSESDSANETGRRRLSRIKGSPSTATQLGHLKRKAANVSESSPPSKKKKSSDAVEDPARKYCLGKLEELFRDVFLRYPHVRSETTDEDMDLNDSKGKIISKKIEELSEKEMEALIDEAKQFARDLEGCVYDIYSEPDKQGNVHAGGKYKYVALSFPKTLSVQLTFLANV